MPRLLYIDNDSNTFVSHRLALALAAREVGFDVHVATPAGSGVHAIVAAGLTFHPIPLGRAVCPLKDCHTCLALLRLYKRLQPHVVHHLRLKPALYGGWCARISHVPGVVHTLTGLGYLFKGHTIGSAALRVAVEAGLRVAFSNPNHRVIFQNPDDQNLLIRAGVCKRAQTALIRGSGVDLDLFHYAPRNSNVPLVVMPSRMLWDKGVREFVAAAQELTRSGVRARFALVGGPDSGNPTSVPLSQLEAWNRDGDVEYWGWQKDMASVFAQSDIVCLPSAYGEGVPKGLIEAAACGLPIVTTDAPGCRDIVRNDWNGFLVPLRDHRAVATALKRLIEDSAMRSTFGRRSRELVESDFSLDKVIADTCSIYSAVCPTAGPPVKKSRHHVSPELLNNILGRTDSGTLPEGPSV